MCKQQRTSKEHENRLKDLFFFIVEWLPKADAATPNFSLLKRYSNKLRKCVKKITFKNTLNEINDSIVVIIPDIPYAIIFFGF